MTRTINGCEETLWSGILSSGFFFRSLGKTVGKSKNRIHAGEELGG